MFQKLDYVLEILKFRIKRQIPYMLEIVFWLLKEPSQWGTKNMFEQMDKILDLDLWLYIVIF